jgi:hypothetical protein
VVVKVAVVEPAATGTEAGMVRTVLVLDSVTSEAPVGAAADTDRVMVQVEVEPDTTLVGEHCRAETVRGGVTVTVAVAVLPLRAAVTVAD